MGTPLGYIGMKPWRGASWAMAAFLVLMAFSSPVWAQDVELAQDVHVEERLVAARVADLLRKNCSTITGRVFTFWIKAYGLRKYVLSQGYEEQEVRIFLKDKDTKAYIYALAQEYMAARGVSEGDEESLCAFGEREIHQDTIAGSLLKVIG